MALAGDCLLLCAVRLPDAYNLWRRHTDTALGGGTAACPDVCRACSDDCRMAWAFRESEFAGVWHGASGGNCRTAADTAFFCHNSADAGRFGTAGRRRSGAAGGKAFLRRQWGNDMALAAGGLDAVLLCALHQRHSAAA